MANLDNEKRTGAWWQALPSNGCLDTVEGRGDGGIVTPPG